MNTMTRAARAAAGVLAVGAGGLGYASLIERNAFTLRRFSVPVLPPGSAPMRVLHLSDLHLLPRQTPQDRVGPPPRRAGAGPGPQHRRQPRPPAGRARGALRAMEPLLERPGVFVLGSNDYFAPKPKNPALYLTRHHARRTTACAAAHRRTWSRR